MSELIFKSSLFLFFFAASTYAEFDVNNSLIDFYGLSEGKINIVIKDNIDIQGEVTSAGSIALQDNIASENAFIIQKLLDADFNIAGKANLSEWANFRSEESVSGWSSLGGQTTHFLYNNFNPCGSSSGSAVAVASGFFPSVLIVKSLFKGFSKGISTSITNFFSPFNAGKYNFF